MRAIGQHYVFETTLARSNAFGIRVWQPTTSGRKQQLLLGRCHSPSHVPTIHKCNSILREQCCNLQVFAQAIASYIPILPTAYSKLTLVSCGFNMSSPQHPNVMGRACNREAKRPSESHYRVNLAFMSQKCSDNDQGRGDHLELQPRPGNQ
eukprot:3823305-Amphidinium_carterae.1